MSTVDLNPVSYVVLGLVERDGPCTPYGLKTAVSRGVAGFWPFQHSQLYSEPERLADAGLLEEEREDGGRRRRLYRITPLGRQVLRAWLAEPSSEQPQIRSLGLLKLYFGGFAAPEDIEALARAQLAMFAAAIADLDAAEQRLMARADRPYQLQVLQTVRRMEQAAADAWQELAGSKGSPSLPARPKTLRSASRARR